MILDSKFKLNCDKATNGKEAIDAVEKFRQNEEQNPCFCGKNCSNYRLILMDCNMPIIDGIEATTIIRGNVSLD